MANCRSRWAVVVCAALAACAREPKGTPVALEAPSENLEDRQAEWAALARDELKEERLSQALFAANEALALARECRGASDRPECLGRFSGAAPQLGGLGPALLWRRTFVDSLDFKASLLVRLGAAKAALKYSDEAIAIEDPHPYLHQTKGDALFALGRFDDAAVEFQAATDRHGPNWLMAARKAHCLSKQGKKAEAAAAVEQLNADLAAKKSAMRPDDVAALSSPGGEFANVAAELEALDAELK